VKQRCSFCRERTLSKRW